MIEFAVVDAFTDRPGGGNPAAVMVLPAPAAESWMALVAREMNLSETAFLVARPGGYGIRWFTPTVEVDLCGHATLASTHWLWSSGQTAASRLELASKSGPLFAERLPDGWIRLNFPATAPTACAAPDGLLEALGVSALWVGRNQFDYLVQVDSYETVTRLSPDHAWLQRQRVRGVIVTAPGPDGGPDFVSRFFAPGSGIPEDPVTGSAHCTLTPFWAGRLHKQQMLAYQASSRGGRLRVQLQGERVWLEGQAVTVTRGQWLHPPT